MTPAEFRAIRKSLGLTQVEWGDWLGLTDHTHVSRIETGKSNLTATLVRLAEAYKSGYRPEFAKGAP